MIWVALAAFAGSAAASYATVRWQEHRENRLEHATWNAEIMPDVAGPTYLSEDERNVLNCMEFDNPDLDVLDDALDDEGEDE